MAAISTIVAGIGIAAGVAGTVVQMKGAKDAQKGQERAEKLRQQQMELEAQRERRNIIRQTLQARATALSNASAQGAEGGSGLQGGYGQIQSQGGNAMIATNENQAIGQQMFSAQRQISRGNSMSATGSGISSLGGALVQNSDTIGRIGNYAFGNRA